MRILRAILPLFFTAALVYALSVSIAGNPALGSLLDPIGGFWTSAEPADKDFNSALVLPDIKSDVEVWFDDRLVPHIKAENDYDLYYAQGYIHASFRLWQMEMQTRAAAGRISEIIGEKALSFDRTQRRKGMVYGAEESLKAMEADPRTRTALNAYRDGVNVYISGLDKKDYPLEYKLMGFEPERWSNLKSALLLMYMSDDLSGDVLDVGLSYYLQGVLTKEQLDFYFPEKVPGSTPVIPEGTDYLPPSLSIPDMPDGHLWPKLTYEKRPEDNTQTGKGSNNWVVGGSKTTSGKPILCNDPHLSLNLPSLWFEVQLSAPGINVYGVSLPGAPGVIIGFNDNISWGFTNNYRDVKDYYTIDVINNDQYRFNGEATDFKKRVELIKIKGGDDVMDTVKYTVHGPLMYDKDFKEPNGIQQPLAIKWIALEESNELLAVYLLNRARNYEGYVTAINNFLCPAQNFIYSDIKGNIALWGQGQYINKWKEQGRFIMEGEDSLTLWGERIPVQENPHALNPAQGYLSSANQNVADTSYPYWFNGRFNELRAWRINEALDTINNVSVEDMFRLQNDNHSVLARMITPHLLGVLKAKGIEDEYTQLLSDWDYNYSADSKAAGVFQLWWNVLYPTLWAQTFKVSPDGLKPLPERTAQILLNHKDSLKNADAVIVATYKKTADTVALLEEQGELEWYKIKNTSINHLAKLAPFSYSGIENGGWGNTINAMKGNHGPSWRMVVHMNEHPEAYGIYPGGQSGNPGSKYYADFIDKWAQGEYNRLTFTTYGQEPASEQVKYNWVLKKEQE